MTTTAMRAAMAIVRVSMGASGAGRELLASPTRRLRASHGGFARRGGGTAAPTVMPRPGRGVASRDEVLELLSAKARAGDVAAMVALLSHYRTGEERARRRRRPSTRVDGTRSWREIKDEVLARDNGICHICGKPGATTVDHLKPRALGGTDDPENCAAAHESCNNLRGCGPIPDRATAIHLAAEFAAS